MPFRIKIVSCQDSRRWYAKYLGTDQDFENVKDNETSIASIRKGLEDAVHRQMMSDVPYGVLLSGGLDSSCIVTGKQIGRAHV